MEGLLASKFTLGGEASGRGRTGRPRRRGADRCDDACGYPFLVAFEGCICPLLLQGGTLRPDEDANKALYVEKKTTTKKNNQREG